MELLDKTYFVMPNWKWIALSVVFVAGIILRPLIRGALRRTKKIPLRWTSAQTYLGHFVALKIERPLSGILVAGVWLITIDAVAPPERFEKYLLTLTHIWIGFSLIFLFYLMVDALGVMMESWANSSKNTLDRQLVPFARKTLKVLVVILGTLVLLQNLGVNVVSLLAGLSIGGLALALAAQDTFANLFGSITIFVDTPFKIGDEIKVNDVQGVVEEIGFRSTRLRTTGNSLVSIPNSVVAKEKIDNISMRRLRRVQEVLGFNYATTPEKMRSFCDGVREYLKRDPQIDPPTVSVYFNNFNTSTLDVTVVYNIKTTDGLEELAITERTNLEIWRIAQRLQMDFAFPTSTVFYKNPAT